VVLPGLGRDRLLCDHVVRLRGGVERRLSAGPLRGGGGLPNAGRRIRPDGGALGGAPGPDDGGLRPRQPALVLVRRRAELPDRAPPVPKGLSPALPRAGAVGRGDLPGVRCQVRGPSDAVLEPRLTLSLAAADGPGDGELIYVILERATCRSLT